MKSKDTSRLVTSGEAARILGVSQVTVGTMAEDGRLPVALVVSGMRVFRVEDVERLAAERAER